MNSPTPDQPFEVAGRRVLVTGASGFLGSSVISRILADGAKVAGLSRTPGRAAALAGHGSYEFIPCDLEDRDRAVRAVRGFAPEVILHFASRPDGAESIDHCRASVSANLLATVNLLEACTRDLQVLVYADSCKVHGTADPPYREHTPVEPNSSYAATKAAGWWLCRVFARANSFATVSVRPTLIYGPGQGLNLIEYVAVKALTGASDIPLDGGSQTRDPLFIDDAVEVYSRVVRHAPRLSGRAIPVGGGIEITVERLANQIVTACGSMQRVRTCPERVRSTEIWHSWCNNEDANRLLDWSPRTSLAQGLDRTISSIRARLGTGPAPA